MLAHIRNQFIDAVTVRMSTERQIGALLSGGLDSSLVCSIASDYLKQHNLGKLYTFSIGMPGSTDEHFASLVAAHCDTIHTHVEFSETDFLNAIPEVISVIESYDITSVRASVGQYLLSKWIKNNTNIRVLLVGDGSDELCSGYMYFHHAPSPRDAHLENIKLLSNIQYFDVLRADRCIAANGIEARVPFLDKEFVDFWLSLPKHLRIPIYHDKLNRNVEKYLLRTAFDELSPVTNSPYLPFTILWRKKEAFSDGVSSLGKSWFTIIQEHLKTKYSFSDYEKNNVNYHITPISDEALHYRIIFNHYFNTFIKPIPYYWMPSWIPNSSDPSARTLEVYNISI
jgi:asparagine synthase (glutamine-hydrolysing)